MKKNLVLIGMPGCGKTAFGQRLARRYRMSFVDMDEWIEKESGKTVRQLFERGEDFFRDWESKACRTLAQKEGVILSTGGGVVKREENIRVLRKTGVVVFLDPPIIKKRAG